MWYIACKLNFLNVKKTYSSIIYRFVLHFNMLLLCVYLCPRKSYLAWIKCEKLRQWQILVLTVIFSLGGLYTAIYKHRKIWKHQTEEVCLDKHGHVCADEILRNTLIRALICFLNVICSYQSDASSQHNRRKQRIVTKSRLASPR